MPYEAQCNVTTGRYKVVRSDKQLRGYRAEAHALAAQGGAQQQGGSWLNSLSGMLGSGAVATNASLAPPPESLTLEQVQSAVDSMPKPPLGNSIRFVYPNLPTGRTHYCAGIDFGSGVDYSKIAITTGSITVPVTYVYDVLDNGMYGFMQTTGLAQQAAQTTNNFYDPQMQYGVGVGQLGRLGQQQAIMNGSMNAYMNIIYPDKTPEQRAAWAAAEKERAVKMEVAESRAEQLMFSLLKQEQVAQYKELGYFETEVDDRIYRIKKGRSMNVELIVKGRPTIRYCAHPSDWTPAPDAMIAQLLMLKTNEKKFIATANRTLLAA